MLLHKAKLEDMRMKNEEEENYRVYRHKKIAKAEEEFE